MILWRFAKQSEAIGPSQIVHPYTKQPFAPAIYPASRRALAAFLVALFFAVSVWGWYKTPLRSLFLQAQLPWLRSLHISPPLNALVTNGRQRQAIPNRLSRASLARRPILGEPPSASNGQPVELSRANLPPSTKNPEPASPAPVRPIVPNPAAGGASIASSAPPGIIPQDPIEAARVVDQLQQG